MEGYLKQHSNVVRSLMGACDHLSLSPGSQATACNLYHKAIWLQARSKEQAIEEHLLAATCVHLAAKINEEPQKIRDVVNICYRMYHPSGDSLEIGKTYWNLRDSITTCELVLLRLLKFRVSTDPPLKYLVHFLELAENWGDPRREWGRWKIHQVCFNLANDSSFLPLLIDHKPEQVAVACMYIAFQTTAFEMPATESGKEWYEVLSPGTSIEQIQALSCLVLSVYEYFNNDS